MVTSNEMSLEEAMDKAKMYGGRDKDIPSVSRTLAAEIERLRIIESHQVTMAQTLEARDWEIERLRDIINPGDAAAYEEGMAAQRLKHLQLQHERDAILEDLAGVKRIIERAESWITIQLAAHSSAKGESIQRSMVDWLSGNRTTHETSTPQAPIAKVTVFGHLPPAVSLYAPGLPPGNHDLYCEPPSNDQCYPYALRLLNAWVNRFGRPKGFEPMSDLLGVLTQIDNVVTGLLEQMPPETFGDAADASRFRWLCTDHNDKFERESCREILGRMPVMSHSATSAAIDGAMLEFCPNHMSPQQRADWAAHQRPAAKTPATLSDFVHASSAERERIGAPIARRADEAQQAVLERAQKTPERRLTASEEQSFTETFRRSPRRVDEKTEACPVHSQPGHPFADCTCPALKASGEHPCAYPGCTAIIGRDATYCADHEPLKASGDALKVGPKFFRIQSKKDKFQFFDYDARHWEFVVVPETVPAPQCNCPRDDMGAHAIWCDVNGNEG